MKLFDKTYDGESIVDLDRDISEAFDPAFNPPAAVIPKDQYGFQQGAFKVTVEWLWEGQQSAQDELLKALEPFVRLSVPEDHADYTPEELAELGDKNDFFIQYADIRALRAVVAKIKGDKA